MGYSKLYDALIKDADKLVKEKSDKDLYEIGKKLPFIERTIFDYKIKSIKENFQFYERFGEYVNKNNMIKNIINNDELDYVLKNFDSLTSYAFEIIEPIFIYIRDNMNRIDKNELENIKYSIIKKMLNMVFELSEEDINKVKDLFEETAEKEGLTLFDIKQLDYGSYSKIYKIGNKIIKVGNKRVIERIVDNNRILLPDKLIKIKSNIIEITDYIEGNNNSTREEIYEVYKELRDQGIVWLDPTKENLRRLDDKTIELQKEKAKNRDRYPFIKNRRLINRPLKTNELIIIDLDHLVDERDAAKINEASDYLREDILFTRESFEKRYLLEKKKTIN